MKLLLYKFLLYLASLFAPKKKLKTKKRKTKRKIYQSQIKNIGGVFKGPYLKKLFDNYGECLRENILEKERLALLKYIPRKFSK